eukprot:931504-Pyramimonas_sp.AAC.1
MGLLTAGPLASKNCSHLGGPDWIVKIIHQLSNHVSITDPTEWEIVDGLAHRIDVDCFGDVLRCSIHISDAVDRRVDLGPRHGLFAPEDELESRRLAHEATNDALEELRRGRYQAGEGKWDCGAVQ